MGEDSSREGYYKAKQEEATINNNNDIDKFSKVPSSRQWPGFRNPRIVRVSRSFGGKDRHSKVCTIRGLRDRRIRLSVPTAIQLYDLQDRLGLSQPSKVIDWLLEATKYDIDKLPPLQIPHGFPQFHHHQTLFPHHHLHEPAISLHSSLDIGSVFEKGKWIKASEEEEEGGNGDNNNNNNNNGFGEIPLFHQKHFPSQYYNGMPCNYNNPYHNLEPASLSLSQFGSHGLVFPSQTEFANAQSSSGNGVLFSSGFAAVVPSPSGSSKLLFCPSSSSSSSSSSAAAAAAVTVPSFFPPHQIATSAEDNDPRGQFNNNVHQLLSSSSSHYPHISCLKPLPVPFISSKLLGSDHNQPNKGSNNL